MLYTIEDMLLSKQPKCSIEQVTWMRNRTLFTPELSTKWEIEWVEWVKLVKRLNDEVAGVPPSSLCFYHKVQVSIQVSIYYLSCSILTIIYNSPLPTLVCLSHPGCAPATWMW